MNKFIIVLYLCKFYSNFWRRKNTAYNYFINIV